MSYKALYRTYRPKNFDEVAGQKHIIVTLQNAIKTGKIAHAYLFCGPRGTGKTSMAKLFAKALNCENSENNQCGECQSCIEINEGIHPDVIEIDAASNNGVDQVRDLIDSVNFLPIKGTYKIYIIDEVHMMTTSAFNALLKTLEEPPQHVIFILATTEPHNIIPTILSRCQRYDFSKVSNEDIKNRLLFILDKENVTFDDDALNSIVSLADGGVRDALSILDQVLAYSGGMLKKEDVNELFGLASLQEKITFLLGIIRCNTEQTIELLDAFIKHGLDIKRLTDDLLLILKDILIYLKTTNIDKLSLLKQSDVVLFENIVTTSYLNNLINLFLKMKSEFKFSNDINVLFELYILQMATLDEKTNDSTTLIKHDFKTEKIEIKSETTTFVELDINGEICEISDEDILIAMVSGDKNLRKNMLSLWPQLSNYINNPSYSVFATILKEGIPFVVTNQILILEYDKVETADKINIKTNQVGLNKVISSLTNQDLFVYAITRNRSTTLIKRYQELRQINKLPKKEELNLKEIK